MTEQNQGDSNQNPEANPTPTINTNNIEAGEQVETTQQSQEPAQQSEPKPPIYKRIIAFIAKDGYQPQVANLISFAMLAVTFFLAIYTFRLFYQTSAQTEAAIKSAKSAEDAVKISANTLGADTIYNNKVYKQSRVDADSNDKREDRRDTIAQTNLRLQNKILSAQIKAFEESQREFEIQNRPFLQISDLKLGDIKSGELPTLEFNFTNYGKQPVKIIKNDYASYLQNRYQIVPKFGTYVQTDAASAYLGQGKEYRNTLKMYVVINKKDSVDIKTGLAMFYIDGALRFRNIVTNKVSVYYYTYKLGYPSGAFSTEGIRDTTINISRTFKNK
jgi:hypothetical protein